MPYEFGGAFGGRGVAGKAGTLLSLWLAYAPGQGSNNGVRAYQQWLGGEAKRYDDEMRARYPALESSAPAVQIQPLHHYPDLLYYFDIADPGNAQPLHLHGYATCFGKKQVVMEATH